MAEPTPIRPATPEQRLNYLRQKGYTIHKWWSENNDINVVIFFADLNKEKRATVPTLCRGLNLQLHLDRKFSTNPDTHRSDWYTQWEVCHKYAISREQYKTLVEEKGFKVLYKKVGAVFGKMEGYYALVSDVESLQLPLRQPKEHHDNT